MGRAFQAYYTKPGVFETDRAGNAIVKKGKPVPKRFYAEGWTMEYTDASGRTIRRKAGDSEAQAKDALKQAEHDVLSEKGGLPTQNMAELAFAPLVTDYIQVLTRNASEYHVSETERHIKALLAATRAYRLRDLKPEIVERYLSKLSDGGLASRSVNAPLVAIKSLLNWAVRTRRIPFNPLACVKSVNGEQTRKRRTLSEIEISKLLAAALEGPHRRALNAARTRKDGTTATPRLSLERQASLARDGRNAALAMRVMIEAGLRLNETRCLQWSDVDLDAGVLRLRAETTKNGKAESVPLTPGLSEALTAWKEETKPTDAATVVKVTSRMLRNFDDDLVAAGMATRDDKGKVQKTDAAGRTFDLHSLRHTCGTRLVAAGVDIKTVQTIMRHSTAALTLGVYVHTDKSRMTAAAAALPELTANAHKAVAAVAAAIRTGTDDDDIPPDNTPKPPAGLPSNRQGNAVASSIRGGVQHLQSAGCSTVTQEVGGSNPLSHPILSASEQSASVIETRTCENAAANGVIERDCSEVKAVAEKSNLSRQVTAKGIAAQVEMPSDLAGVVTAWPTLPENLKAAVLALLGIAKV